MILIVKYDRIDFFGRRTYTEDKTEWGTLKDIKKAFQFLEKERQAAIQIDNDGLSTIYFWDNCEDQENKVITERIFKFGYTDTKKSFQKVKKTIYDKFR